MRLRPYQGKGFDDIFAGWNETDVIFFLLATGAGKTVTFMEIIKTFLFNKKKCLLIAHRKELISQAWKTLYNNNIYAGIIKSGVQPKPELPCQVASVQTIANRKTLPPADLIVVDEGHHAQPDNSYGYIFKMYPNAKILLVSATSYRLSGEGFRYIVPGKVTKLVKNSTLKSLTDDGWLVPIRYFASSIPDMSNVHLNKGEYNEEEARKAMQLAPIVESYHEHAAGRMGCVFAINIPHSIHICSQYQYAGIPCAHLDGETPEKERDSILSDFRSGLIKIISNVGIISEGFDVPSMEFVQLARPTKSLSLYLQMVGRVTRPEQGLVDKFNNREERLKAIAHSSKPFGIVLDNSGCCIEHYLPDYDHDWDKHFIGTKGKKQTTVETMEMLVFVVEDKNGVRKRVKNVKEAEGLRLIEITKEVQTNVISIKSLREFDRIYSLFKRQPQINKPGLTAFYEYQKYCIKHGYIMLAPVWDYLKSVLCDGIQRKVHDLEFNKQQQPHIYPDDLYNQTRERLLAEGVNEQFLQIRRKEYEREIA